MKKKRKKCIPRMIPQTLKYTMNPFIKHVHQGTDLLESTVNQTKIVSIGGSVSQRKTSWPPGPVLRHVGGSEERMEKYLRKSQESPCMTDHNCLVSAWTHLEHTLLSHIKVTEEVM